MTLAICINCGSTKFGALTKCKQCDFSPKRDDEIYTSVILTDHYHREDELSNFSKDIKNSGKRLVIEIPPNEKKEFVDNLNRMRAIENAFRRGSIK